jgi:hypothetical protein
MRLSFGVPIAAPMSTEFLREEFADMIEAGQWIALPYAAVRHLPGLQLSPTGVVPQRDRRPRVIVDYTFSGVNQHTYALAADSLQFGHAFLQILQQLHRADTRDDTIYLSKTDIADAFMRVGIWAPTIPIRGALLPILPVEEPLVAFPLILPMGWVESPQYLCAVSETIADIANMRLQANDASVPTHRLEAFANSRPETMAQSGTALEPTICPPTVRSTGPL